MNKFLTTIVMGVLWPFAAAAEVPAWNDIKGELKTVLETSGDPARGATAFEPCEGCHRKDASGRTSGAYPRLSGQYATVVIKQITDIRAGRRYNPKMAPFIGGLSPVDIADIAAHLQALPISAENGKGPGKAVAAGKQLYDADCADCHGDKGQGIEQKFYPMVAAQHYGYLLRELKQIRDGDRRNSNPEMVRVIKSRTMADLEAMADFMARLPPPVKN